MFNLKGRAWPFFVLFAVVVLGYAQVAFGLSALKWDLIDVVFPFRFFFSESLGAGEFPFWNPFQQTGTPFFADLQAPTYYPELWIVTLLGGYSIYAMHILMILYLFLAASGMYALIRDYSESTMAGLMAGIAFAFSGYLVGHGQHFFLIVGAAWIPFVFRSYVKMNQSGEITQALGAAVFTFLLLTGAYQALSISVFYLLVGVFLFTLTRRFREKRSIWPLLRVNVVYALVTLILCLPLIMATIEVIPLVDRLSGGVELNRTLEYGQPISGLLSFIAPYATLPFDDLFGNIDKALINHYVGLVPLIFFAMSLTKLQVKPLYLLLLFGLVVFSMSFAYLPIRGWIHRAIPLMDLFLLAAYIRVFGIMAIIGFAALYFSRLDRYVDRDRNKILGIIALISLGVLWLIWADQTHQWQRAEGFESTRLTGPALVSLSVLALMAIVVMRYRFIARPKLALILILIADVTVLAQWNFKETVIDSNHNPSQMQLDLNLAPQGFPTPINSKVAFNDEKHAFFPPFWRNTYILTKRVSFDSFSSFKLQTYAELDENRPYLRDAVIVNSLVYLSDSIAPISGLTEGRGVYDGPSELLHLEDSVFNRFASSSLKQSALDQVFLREFRPTRVTVETRTEHDQMLTLLQTNYRGWKAFIDDQEVPIHTSNFNYRTVFLPAGDHSVRFEYSNSILLVLYGISNGLFVLLVLFFVGNAMKKGGQRKGIYLGLPILMFAGLVFLYSKHIRISRKAETITDHYQRRFDPAEADQHWSLDFEDPELPIDSIHTISGLQGGVVGAVDRTYPLLKLVQGRDSIKPGTLFVQFKLYPEHYVDALLVSEIGGEWHASPLRRHIESLKRWNTFQYIRRIPELKTGDELKVYLWNRKAEQFLIDDTEVSLYWY